MKPGRSPFPSCGCCGKDQSNHRKGIVQGEDDSAKSKTHIRGFLSFNFPRIHKLQDLDIDDLGGEVTWVEPTSDIQFVRFYDVCFGPLTCPLLFTPLAKTGVLFLSSRVLYTMRS